jgi:hypothetical protein
VQELCTPKNIDVHFAMLSCISHWSHQAVTAFKLLCKFCAATAYLAQAAASFQLRAETTRRKSAALAGAKASVVQVQCICNFERRKQQLVVRLGTFTRVTFRATFFDQSSLH